MNFDFTSQVKTKTDQELLDIYQHEADYLPEFIKLIEAELVERNVPIDHIRKLRQENWEMEISELESGRDGSPLLIFFGFIFSLLGGILGICIGYVYSRGKRVAGNGEKVYTYNKETRELGNIMMWIGIVVISIVFIWRILE